MKKAILGILGVLVLVIVGFCIVVAMQPADFKIERSATFTTAPENVFAQINDFHKWNAWSPWAKIDPNMRSTFNGPESGVGSSYYWIGNDQVGEGKMTITASQPNERIAIDLDFIAPFAAKNLTEFTIKPSGDKTDVTWSMTGKRDFVMKAFCLFFDMDKLVGGDFEKGLAQLKTTVEASK